MTLEYAKKWKKGIGTTPFIWVPGTLNKHNRFLSNKTYEKETGQFHPQLVAVQTNYYYQSRQGVLPYTE